MKTTRTAHTTIAFNFELTEGQLPDWLLLVPAGQFSGRDGRTWINAQPDQVVFAFQANQRDIVVDLEHAAELKAPQGEPAPAQAWITALENRDGAIWGRVEYTDPGRALIESRQYRYYSPAFHFDSGGVIWSMASVGLTNKHNLYLPALNNEGDHAMKLALAIALALGLNHETASEDDAVAAIKKLQAERETALNAQKVPDLNLYVPRADYDLQLQKASNAQQQLDQVNQRQKDAEITAEVDAAVKAGKVAPASRDVYLAICRQDGGLENFRKLVDAAPVIAKDSGLDDQDPAQGQVALNGEMAQVAALFGNSADDINTFGK